MRLTAGPLTSMLAHMATNAHVSTAFLITAKDGKARCGTLTTRHGPIQTPAVLLYTRRGGPLSLTPDMIAKLEPQPHAAMVCTMQL